MKKRIDAYVPGPRNKPGWTRTVTRDHRRFNVVNLGLSGLEWSDLYHSLISVPWRTFFLGVALWYVSANLFFAALYEMAGPSHLQGLQATSGPAFFAECFFFSVQTLATIGYGRINPIGFTTNAIVAVEALFGMLTLAVITGLLFARFSRPTSRLEFSNKALVTTMDGLPHFNFRVTNARSNHVVEASIALSLLRTETTAEGQRFRNWHDLKLERSHTPILSLTWTVVHPIDGESPLKGLTAADLEKDNIQFFVTVWGVDENLGQTIYSRYLYGPSDVVWNAQFNDMLDVQDGRILVDRSKLHDFVQQS